LAVGRHWARFTRGTGAPESSMYALLVSIPLNSCLTLQALLFLPGKSLISRHTVQLLESRFLWADKHFTPAKPRWDLYYF